MERLWEIADKEGIYVTYQNLWRPDNKLLGMYFCHPDTGPVITLDKSLKNIRRTHRCIFAEEVGHHHTAPRTNFHRVYGNFSLYGKNNEHIKMAQDERKALQWATDFLIPDVELCRALENGLRSCYELAEFFDVTEWMMHRKMGFLHMCFRRQGLKVNGRDLYNVSMAPCNFTYNNAFSDGAGV